jgi:hypothetical protein
MVTEEQIREHIVSKEPLYYLNTYNQIRSSVILSYSVDNQGLLVELENSDKKYSHALYDATGFRREYMVIGRGLGW